MSGLLSSFLIHFLPNDEFLQPATASAPPLQVEVRRRPRNPTRDGERGAQCRLSYFFVSACSRQISAIRESGLSPPSSNWKSSLFNAGG